MANADTPRGLWPIRHIAGGTIRVETFSIASALAENIFKGDLVNIAASGLIEPNAATEVNAIGVFQGVSYKNSAGESKFSNYWPTGTVATEIKAMVIADPFVIFGIQSTTGGNPQVTNIGNCADIVATAGDTATGISRFELSGTMAAGTAQCKILGLVPEDGNAWGEHAMLEVLINEHLVKDSAGI
jgi:hypothetical protein